MYPSQPPLCYGEGSMPPSPFPLEWGGTITTGKCHPTWDQVKGFINTSQDYHPTWTDRFTWSSGGEGGGCRLHVFWGRG
eukprot:8991924-Alexandrium_andersonii.AAC.1